MSINQAKEEKENIKDLIEDNKKQIKQIKICLNEIYDNDEGIRTSLRYIENELKRVRK